MNVGQLKKLISDANLPDDAPVLLPGLGYSYYVAEYPKTVATQSGHYFSEYFGAEHLASGEKKIQALILR